MYISELTIENFRIFGEGDDSLVLELRPGLNALVGENDSGKTAIIDALRLALGTADQEWFRLEDSDFHGDNGSAPILIACLFSGLTRADRRAFAEFLSYDPDGVGEPVFCLNVTVADTGRLRRGRPYRRIEFRSGLDGTGPIVPQEERDLLRATYLRPLRDAEQELTSGRGSRLSQVLFHSAQVRDAGEDYDPEVDTDPAALSVLGIGDYADSLLVSQTGVANAKHAIDEHLKSLALAGEPVTTDIGVGGSGASDEARLRRILEKLDLGLGGLGRRGLGSNSRLFIACELLLLTQEEEGSRLLLIEEPEAHLDAQRQLQLAKAIREQADSTLVLESYWFAHNLEKLAPWLLGDKQGLNAEGDRQAKRLRTHYVAMTRATHMLCLAMRRSSWVTGKPEVDAATAATLEARGWTVVTLVESEGPEFSIDPAAPA